MNNIFFFFLRMDAQFRKSFSFIYHALLLPHRMVFSSKFFIKIIINLWDMCAPSALKPLLNWTIWPQYLKWVLHILHWEYFEHFWHITNFALLTQFLKYRKIERQNTTFLEWMITWQYYLEGRDFLAIIH